MSDDERRSENLDINPNKSATYRPPTELLLDNDAEITLDDVMNNGDQSEVLLSKPAPPLLERTDSSEINDRLTPPLSAGARKLLGEAQNRLARRELRRQEWEEIFGTDDTSQQFGSVTDEVDEAAEAERRRQEEKADEERRKREAQAKMRAAQAKKKGSKRKGLCLTVEKKKLLKQLIMEKAAEEMRAEAKKRAEEKERHINANVPSLNLDSLDKSALLRKVQELHKTMKYKEEEKYEYEVKIRKQDLEINELTSTVNDVRGKYNKPVLKKVTKTEKLAAKVEKKAGIGDIRSSLKSTGQSKYQLDDQPQEPKTPDWKAELKPKVKEDEAELNGEVGDEVEAEA